MPGATVFPLITVEEFDTLPDPKGNFTYELQFGRLVEVGRSRKAETLLQWSVRDRLSGLLDTRRWFIEIEIPYNLVEGYDARAADVGVVTMARFEKVPDDGWLIGSPELVVFVKSRSNSDKQVEKNAIECLTHGAEAVWSVKRNPEITYVYTASGKKEYRPGQSIPLPSSMSGRIKVRDIFKGLAR